MTIQLTQLTPARSSDIRSGFASASDSRVRPAADHHDGHHFSQSLSGSGSSDEKLSAMATDGNADKTSGNSSDMSTKEEVTELCKEDKTGNESAENRVSTGQADLAQQIAYLLQAQQVANPQALRQGFANSEGVDTPLTSAALTNMMGNNTLRRVGNADSPVHDIPEPADLHANGTNLEQSRPQIAGVAAQLHDGDLSALANALSDKTLSASVVAVSQQGLNAITEKPAPAATMPTRADAMSTPSPTLYLDINKPQWGDALIEQLRQRIQVQSGNKLQHAQIRLDPPELGKLEISLRMEGDKLSVQFTAAHPQLREALLAGSDRLRQDFSQSQMNLIDVSVSGGQPQHGNQQQQDPSFANGHSVIRRAAAHSSIPALNLSHHRTDFDSLV
ncbi:MAG: flagellar hook-length control protein FliK [Plesiomonas sp.]|uniref:flagellar hook-length control protein FliK n=1 Tax=Plesiomonas sp. TaxID=2486279 RepID=UPI003F30140E